MERLFKVFTELLTKKKNRLATDTMFDTACIKDSMKRKYPEDRKTRTGQKTKYGSVCPSIHGPRVIPRVLPGTPHVPGTPHPVFLFTPDVRCEMLPISL